MAGNRASIRDRSIRMGSLIHRWDDNPILGPNAELPWAKDQARNPGAIWDGRKFRLVYTTVSNFKDGGDFVLGYAESADGLHFELSAEPFMTPPGDAGAFDFGGLEDTRITQLGDTYYIAYAGRAKHPLDYWLKKHDGWDPKINPTWSQNYRRVGLATTKDWKHIERLGPITSEEFSDANVVLFPETFGGRYAMLHRPTPFNPGEIHCMYAPGAIWIAFSDNLTDWGWRDDLSHAKWTQRIDHLADDHLLIRPEYEWERMKVGGAGVPIATDDGWLMFYHAVDIQGTYRIGLLLLDREDPRRVLARTPEPIMEPVTPYERDGHYTLGEGCVFPCANVVVDDEVFIYYGAADSYCCVATARLQALLDHVLAHRDHSAMISQTSRNG
jgi:predicted GH43/DUF377 family glycosyl hydrolase